MAGTRMSWLRGLFPSSVIIGSNKDEQASENMVKKYEENI